VVVAVEGAAIASAGGLLRAIAEAPPGAQLTLQVLRAGRPETVTVRTARRSDQG
jgi:S1-C subfamily serine protease